MRGRNRVASLVAVILACSSFVGCSDDDDAEASPKGSGESEKESMALAYAPAIEIPEHVDQTLATFGCQLCKTETGGKPAPDFLATIDVDPKSSEYGQIVARTPLPATAPEMHHMHLDARGTRAIAYDIYANKANVFDVESDPRQPVLIRQVDIAEESRKLLGVVPGLGHAVGYSFPHESYRLPSGNFLVAMASAYVPESAEFHDGPPGGFVEINGEGDVVSAFPPFQFTNGQLTNGQFAGVGPFGLDYDARLGMLVHADTVTARNFKCTVGKAGDKEFGNEVVLWNFDPKKPAGATVFQKVSLPAGVLTSPYFVRKPVAGKDVIYVSTFTAGVWVGTRPTGTSEQFVFAQAFALGEGHGVAHLRLHPSKDVVYAQDAIGNTLFVLDYSKDPLHPEKIQEVHLDEVHMLRFSKDAKTLYGTNGLASIIGYQFRNPPYSSMYGIRTWSVDETGKLGETEIMTDLRNLPDKSPESNGLFFGDFFLRENATAYP